MKRKYHQVYLKVQFLSPILFNIMLSDLNTGNNATRVEYADDLLIYAIGENLNDVTYNLQQQLTRKPILGS